jgi:hypothetical protein
VHNCAPPRKEILGGSLTVNQALDAGEEFLGAGYFEKASGVFRSADDMRQFRITPSDWATSGAHVHFETIAPGGRVPSINWRFNLLDP